MTNRTHRFNVKIDRALFEEVRAMLVAIDQGRHQRRCGGDVPWGAWADLMDTILRDWLATQQRVLVNRQHAREFAHATQWSNTKQYTYREEP